MARPLPVPRSRRDDPSDPSLGAYEERRDQGSPGRDPRTPRRPPASTAPTRRISESRSQKDPDHVGATPSLAVEPLGGATRPDLSRDLLGEAAGALTLERTALNRTTRYGSGRACREVWSAMSMPTAQELTMTHPPPEPDPGRPLTEQERRFLADIGSDLQKTDPRLGQRLSARGDGSTAVTLDRLVQAAAILVITLVLIPADWRGMVLVLVLMVGVPLIALLGLDPAVRGWGRPAARNRRPPDSGPPSP